MALALAQQGAGQVSPNPLVGCLVVNGEEIVGRGFHRYHELKHAEAWALEEAGAQARGATVYLSLEPCSHNGAGKRTPPCADALIAAGVSRVVAAMVDPNPLVNGRGFARIRAAGIAVTVGLMEAEARRLNEKYIRFVTSGLPFVHLKAACSLDGRIATRTGESKWITGVEARSESGRLRNQYDAILVGIRTVLADDPLLTDRSGLPRHRPLVRVVLDAALRTPLNSQLVRTAKEIPLLIFAADQELIDNMGFPVHSDAGSTLEIRQKALEKCGAEVIRVGADGGLLHLSEVLSAVGQRALTSLLVEGGAEVAGSFIEKRLLDKVTFFIAPTLIGGWEAKSVIGGSGVETLEQAIRLHDVQVIQHGADWEFTGYPAGL